MHVSGVYEAIAVETWIPLGGLLKQEFHRPYSSTPDSAPSTRYHEYHEQFKNASVHPKLAAGEDIVQVLQIACWQNFAFLVTYA